ncbi:MAG: hypothetical protein PWP56_427 [Acetobacterium sp.]|jgi:hypothetical protein|uniref:hypothetical protein n=1 Tax=Acetobacterium TaxID=33951 RepID=UPI0029DF12D5|nr:hypothetical protein [Acetobacterium sp. K1/6]MDK2940914.1 hypothetical protein [Acetobacterium sp.]MDZ5723633.1 hypothetical protein [Acetobacterium sp. K1/6]
MNQLISNNLFSLSELEKKVINLNHSQIKQLFEQPQKTCMKFLKSLWTEVDIESHCKLTTIDFDTVKRTEDILIPETNDAQCHECLKASKHKLSAFEQLSLFNYNLAMNDFGDGKIKESFSSYDHYL